MGVFLEPRPLHQGRPRGNLRQSRGTIQDLGASSRAVPERLTTLPLPAWKGPLHTTSASCSSRDPKNPVVVLAQNKRPEPDITGGQHLVIRRAWLTGHPTMRPCVGQIRP